MHSKLGMHKQPERKEEEERIRNNNEEKRKASFIYSSYGAIIEIKFSQENPWKCSIANLFMSHHDMLNYVCWNFIFLQPNVSHFLNQITSFILHIQHSILMYGETGYGINY